MDPQEVTEEPEEYSVEKVMEGIAQLHNLLLDNAQGKETPLDESISIKDEEIEQRVTRSRGFWSDFIYGPDSSAPTPSKSIEVWKAGYGMVGDGGRFVRIYLAKDADIVYVELRGGQLAVPLESAHLDGASHQELYEMAKTIALNHDTAVDALRLDVKHRLEWTADGVYMD